MTDELVDEVEAARRTRLIVTGMFVALVLLFAGFLWWQDNQRSAACRAAIATRDEHEAKDVGLWSRAADELDASPEVREGFLEFIRETYAEMPAPSSC